MSHHHQLLRLFLSGTNFIRGAEPVTAHEAAVWESYLRPADLPYQERIHCIAGEGHAPEKDGEGMDDPDVAIRPIPPHQEIVQHKPKHSPHKPAEPGQQLLVGDLSL